MDTSEEQKPEPEPRLDAIAEDEEGEEVSTRVESLQNVAVTEEYRMPHTEDSLEKIPEERVVVDSKADGMTDSTSELISKSSPELSAEELPSDEVSKPSTEEMVKLSTEDIIEPVDESSETVGEERVESISKEQRMHESEEQPNFANGTEIEGVVDTNVTEELDTDQGVADTNVIDADQEDEKGDKIADENTNQ